MMSGTKRILDIVMKFGRLFCHEGVGGFTDIAPHTREGVDQSQRSRVLLRWASIFCLFIFIFAAGPANSAPFWKDPKYYKRIQEQKFIAVKASTDDSKKPEIMNIEGAAQVAAPIDFVFK